MHKFFIYIGLLFVGANSYSQSCDLVKFKSANIIGTALIDQDFVPLMKEISDMAGEAGVKLLVTSSHKTTPRVKGESTILRTPDEVTENNHFGGHSVDVFIKYSGGTVKRQYLNQEETEWDSEILVFIERIREHEILRTGEHSQHPDYIHIEDGLSVRNPELFNARVIAVQAAKDSNCATTLNY